MSHKSVACRICFLPIVPSTATVTCATLFNSPSANTVLGPVKQRHQPRDRLHFGIPFAARTLFLHTLKPWAFSDVASFFPTVDRHCLNHHKSTTNFIATTGQLHCHRPWPTPLMLPVAIIGSRLSFDGPHNVDPNDAAPHPLNISFASMTTDDSRRTPFHRV
ncbi:hypothetical protein U1Q18_007753 [Sarracenia purpurea var. burkii]